MELMRVTVILYLYVLLFTSATASNFLSIRQQSSDGNATISLIDSEDGTVAATSDLSFAYKRPSIEVTATDDSNYYIVSFPSDDSNGSAHLWELNSKLMVKKEWVQPKDGLEFFDLQYSSLQSELFGIAVNGTYGRVISHLDVSGDEVVANYLVTCPYMWYVNASTFDHKNDQYYALLNNFKDPTLGQQIMVVDVNDGSQVIYKYDPSEILLYYITYTAKGVFAMGADSTGVAELGTLTFGNNNNDDKIVGRRTGDDGSFGDDDEATATFNSELTFDGSLGKYSPIFQSSDDNGQVCIALGNIEGSPQLECYTMQGGQLTEPVDILPTRSGNVAAVAFYV